MLYVTVVLNIWKEAKRRTFKLMRYVTETVTQPISYIAALLFFCFFSCINLSHSLSLSVLLFFPSFPHKTILMQHLPALSMELWSLELLQPG